MSKITKELKAAAANNKVLSRRSSGTSKRSDSRGSAKSGRLNTLLKTVRSQVFDEGVEPQDEQEKSKSKSKETSPAEETDKSNDTQQIQQGSSSVTRTTVIQADEAGTPKRIPVKRKVSWAFWSSPGDKAAVKTAAEEVAGKPSEVEVNVEASKKANETTPVPTEATKDAKAPETTETTTAPPTKDDKTKERSWSFWASKQEGRALPFQPNVIVRSTATYKVHHKSRTGTTKVDKVNASANTQESNRTESSSESSPKTGTSSDEGTQPPASESDQHESTTKKKKRPSLIVPSLKETLPPSTPYTTLARGFKRAKLMLGYPAERQMFLHRKASPTKFRRVLIIGVHGFFPTKAIRRFIGEPTGTSMKFAQIAEKAVLSWAKSNHMAVEIQKLALEKEGKIFDRVDFFFEILKKSAKDIEQADFVFVCAHSQGTPVAIILLSKLLEYGIIDDKQKVGILGMAGINNGPFYGMEQSLFVRAYSTFENESMLELFQFQNFESLQSRKYVESVRNLVRHNVKITFVGSINDQLVPLYSAIASHVNHPNIYKSVYIDGGTDTPDFVSRIVKLSCMLQNLGYSDHDVIKEISYALAGPLTGGGHSTVYNDVNVYKLALNFTLKTEDSSLVMEEPVLFKPFDLKKLGSNPFNLPWCVRGLFFEVIRRLYRGRKEIDMVFKEFDEWDPESKALKDVKYRLSGMKAKL